MKKIYNKVLILFMPLVIFIPFIYGITSEAATAENVYIINGDIQEKEFSVPEEIDNEIVTKVSFYDNTSIEKLYIPKNVTEVYIEGKTSKRYALKELIVSEDNPNFTSVDGVLYSKDMKVLYYYPCDKSDEVFNVPEPVETIGAYPNTTSSWAFANCQNLKEINFNKNIKIISDATFYNSSLENVFIPEGVEIIGNSAFSDCNKLKEITVSKGVRNIKYPVYNCSALETVTFLEDDIDMPDLFAPTPYPYTDDLPYIDFFTEVNSRNRIKVYVPNNKFDVYREISNWWDNVDVELLPIIEKSETTESTTETTSTTISEPTTLDEPTEPTLIGDVDLNNIVELADLTMLSKYLLNETAFPLKNAVATANADMNSDGLINTVDLSVLIENQLGKADKK